MQPPNAVNGDNAEQLSDLRGKIVFEWIRRSDFETVAWSTAKAAKAFKVKQDQIYDALAALTKKTEEYTNLFPRWKPTCCC